MFYLAFLFGLVFGSFLNVVIYRLKSGDSIRFGRSFCPRCKTILKWHDLVPLLSFFLLKGQCRHCRKKISWQYPAVEILSGLIWVFVWNLGFGIWNFIYYIFILSAFLVIAIYDFKWKIIPDKIIYPAIAVVLIFNLFEILKYQNIAIFLWPLSVAIIAFLFFFSIFYFSKGRAIGLGDAKLAFLIGLFLEPELAFFAFTLSFILGAVYAIILLILGKKTLKDKIALAPFLSASTAIIFFL